MPGHLGQSERFSLAAAFGLYTIAFLALAWPWLSGAVEIPYDAASQFYPQLAFLARSFATGNRRSGRPTSSPAGRRSPIRSR